MARSHEHDDALPDDKPASAGGQVRNTNAPDLGGSFEENGQVRRHDGIGAGPGMTVPEEGLRAAREAERNSSAGS
jgi:hypothetical protein